MSLRALSYQPLPWVLIGLFAACSAPVNRTSPVVDTIPAAPQFQSPDLKKRIFLLPFKELVPVPEQAKNVSAAKLLNEKLIDSFGKAASPFIPQTSTDEEAIRSLQLSSDRDPKAIAKALRGSDIAGFVVGSITELRLADTGGDSEGLLKSKTMNFKFGIEYELYDTTTGRRLAGGSDSQSYSETRSDMFGQSSPMPELDKRMTELATNLSEKVFNRLLPFSEKLAWGGRVLRIDGTRIYLNAGRKTGILVGDVLKIIESPRDIVDPQNGDFVGEAPGRIKGTVKVIQYFGLDGAVAVLQSGGGIFPGDRVELF